MLFAKVDGGDDIDGDDNDDDNGGGDNDNALQGLQIKQKHYYVHLRRKYNIYCVKVISQIFHGNKSSSFIVLQLVQLNVLCN